MKIALATPRIAKSLEDGLAKIETFLAQASAANAQIICFPEAYLPGLRGLDFDVFPWGQADYDHVVQQVASMAKAHGITTILGIEKPTPAGGQIVAVVFNPDGTLQGYQAKTQLDPSEDRFYVAGDSRQIFEANGIKFGIAICHEGWRYPETVRWAAARGAKIVFHPQHTGYEQKGTRLTEWGSADAPYYEKAMMCGGLENTVYFASVNYALRYQESATSLIDPTGRCQAFLPYGEEGVLIEEVDVAQATGLLAKRFAPEKY